MHYIFLPLLSGIASTILSKDFRLAPKSPLQPPGLVFSVVWTVLYFMIGYSAYLVSKKQSIPKIFYVQLFLNFLWSIVFTRLGSDVALINIIFLWVAVFITCIKFYEIDTYAGRLLVPYIMWMTFAFLLNATAV